ncbi:MAG: 4-(cytidine 5'-diphospho)-2-C-methyl-D-erythritol kinase [Micrococcales bacterium]|nr:4-(cytidine 5'-diphospho)-2-C-methyl-D-erythritol kinase [Micrococcales bacterium]
MTTTRVTLTAPAKINLALQVAPLGADGYHQLRNVFAAIDMHDDLVCQPAPDGVIHVTVLGRQAALVPRGGTDLTGRAAKLLRDSFGLKDMGAHLTLTKTIPIAGGMAGGSADAAAALRGCNALWGLGVGDDELKALARELGADVPFALMGGVALGTGRGDVLTPLPSSGTFTWVLALATQGLSTASVFATFDQLPELFAPVSLDGLLAGLADGDAKTLGANLMNGLQTAALCLRPELGETLAAGRRLPGVLGAVLCGSGPTCAFLCESPASAKGVAETLAGLPQVSGTRIATSPAPGARIN